MTAGEAIVRFEGVSKAFGDVVVLRDVSFDVPSGHCTVIIGRSGTGKSVALKHIIGLLRPDSGQVFVQGEDIGTLDPSGLARVRRGMGFLFQNSALFDSITVGENVMFPMRRHTDLSEDEMRSRATETLGQVGLEPAFDKMPADLSGGMRKRAGLARAMALRPPLLLVDEPSAGLDPITSAEIDRLLLALKKQGTTVVLVTHHIASARALGDELIFLDQGNVLARGSPDVLAGSEHAMVREFLASTGGG